MVWTLIGVVLVNDLRQLHQDMKVQTPRGETSTQRLLDGLVDDTTIGTNGSGDYATCLEEAQYLAQL